MRSCLSPGLTYFYAASKHMHRLSEWCESKVLLITGDLHVAKFLQNKQFLECS